MRHQPWEYNTSFHKDCATLAMNCKQTFPCGSPLLDILFQQKRTTVPFRLRNCVPKKNIFPKKDKNNVRLGKFQNIFDNYFMQIISGFNL